MRTSRSPFMRHLDACCNARLPGDRRPFRLGSAQVGWVGPEIAAALAEDPRVRQDADGIALTEAGALPGIARDLGQRGLLRWRAEAFDVRAEPDGPALAQIDRGALPAFGIAAEGVHVNGLVRRDGGLRLWVARRAADKPLDPGKLDHITAGGVPAGMTAEETLVKEAAEEASIPAELARRAIRVGRIAYAMDRPEGLRRDRLHCFDLALPEDFTPHAADGEVERFELWPIGEVLEAVRETDDFKFNVNLVLIDLFLREGLIGGTEGLALRQRLDRLGDAPARPASQEA